MTDDIATILAAAFDCPGGSVTPPIVRLSFGLEATKDLGRISCRRWRRRLDHLTPLP